MSQCDILDLLVKHSVTREPALDGSTLCATLRDEKEGELEVTDITFDTGTLTYRYTPPTSQAD